MSNSRSPRRQRRRWSDPGTAVSGDWPQSDHTDFKKRKRRPYLIPLLGVLGMLAWMAAMLYALWALRP